MHDVIFILESNLSTPVLTKIENYTAYADANLKICKHGGIAAYAKNSYAKNIFDLSFSECYVTFRFDFAPTYIVRGVYIQPENSKYFSPNMFAELDSLLSRCIECDYIPFIGGDFNSRLGDLNLLSKSWHYSKNVDVATNVHGRTFMTDICKRNDIYKYKCTNFEGDFTYIKNEKKSQIDFTSTNSDGRNHITSFSIRPQTGMRECMYRL